MERAVTSRVQAKTGWGRGTLRSLALVLALGLASAPMAASTELVQTGRDVFGSLAIRSDNLAPFPKWRGAIERYFQENGASRPPCESGLFTRCAISEWKTFLHAVAALPPEQKMRRVNAFHNETRYILDIVNWQIEDYWASPYQFLDKDGDCEDYAIAKFMSLRALGFSNEQMRIVVLRDLNLRVAHAVLVVDLGGVKYVLDNQISDAVPETVIRHYQPIYSVNETHWWLHRRT